MNSVAVACGREFLRGVVARVLVPEPQEDLFTLRRVTMEMGTQRLRLPDGPGELPLPMETDAMWESERWDGLG